MNFKEWLLSEEQIFNEDFKTQREKFIQQGIEPNIVDAYLNNFRTIKDKNYKQINDPIHGLENVKDRTNVDAYKTFHELEILVDYVKGQVDVSGQTSYKNIKVDAKPIYDDNNITIYYADSPQACITYKGNVPYSWCIARSDASNMFYTYRFKENRPAFYFVKNKERTNDEFKFLNILRNVATLTFKDKYHFFVIQVVKNANPQNKDQKQYIVTSASNDGDKQMSWNEILKIEPLLANLEDKFVSNPLSEKEEKLYQRFIKGILDKEFENLPYDEKDMYLNIYVRMDKTLTDNQFKSLPLDLKNKYIGYGVGLSEEQVKMIDSKLYKRYEEVTKTKIEKTIGTNNFIFKPSEVNIFIKNINEFDCNKLSDENVRKLLQLATDKDKIAESIINNKPELSDDNVYYLILYAADRDKIAESIINKKPELSDDNVFNLFSYARDKDKIVQLLGKNNINKFSDKNVRELLGHATEKDKDKIAQILGADNIKKLSDESIRSLLDYATDKNKMAQIIIKYKPELSDSDVYYLLLYAIGKDKMAQILGADNINKLSDDSVVSLLDNATDKDKMVQILGADKINKLSDENIRNLIFMQDYEDEQHKIIKIITKYKTKLSDKVIVILLVYANDIDEIAELLGTDNISKLSGDNIRSLFEYKNKDLQKKIAQILNQYHQNKTPKIQQLIDKYLYEI
jgi:hypothetical protein